MKNTLSRILLLMILSFAMSFSFVFATETNTIGSTYPNEADMQIVDKVTVDDFVNWVDRKGAEVIGAAQQIAKPICMILFIGSLAMAAFGIFGNDQMVGKGIFGCIIIAVVYGAISIAPFLLEALSSMAIS